MKLYNICSVKLMKPDRDEEFNEVQQSEADTPDCQDENLDYYTTTIIDFEN